MNQQYNNQQPNMNNQQPDMSDRYNPMEDYHNNMNSQYNDINRQRANIDSTDEMLRSQNNVMDNKHTLMDNNPVDIGGQSKHTNDPRIKMGNQYTSGQHQDMNDMNGHFMNMGNQPHRQLTGMNSNPVDMNRQYYDSSNQFLGMKNDHTNILNQSTGMEQDNSNNNVINLLRENPNNYHDIMNTQHSNLNTQHRMMKNKHANLNNDRHDTTNAQHFNPNNHHDIMNTQHTNPNMQQDAIHTQHPSLEDYHDAMNIQPDNPSNHHDIANTHHTSIIPGEEYPSDMKNFNRSSNNEQQTRLNHGVDTSMNNNHKAESKTGAHPTTVEDVNGSSNLTPTSNPIPSKYNNNTSLSTKNYDKSGLSSVSSAPSEYGSSDGNNTPRNSNIKHTPITADENAFINPNEAEKNWQNNMTPADRAKELAKEMNSNIQGHNRSSDDHDKSLKIGENKKIKLD